MMVNENVNMVAETKKFMDALDSFYGLEESMTSYSSSILRRRGLSVMLKISFLKNNMI